MIMRNALAREFIQSSVKSSLICSLLSHRAIRLDLYELGVNSQISVCVLGFYLAASSLLTIRTSMSLTSSA